MKGKLYLIAIVVILISKDLIPQVSVFDIPLSVSDEGGNTIYMNIGLNPRASDGLDTSLGEASLPPMPPSGILDARFELPGPPVDYSCKDYRSNAGVTYAKKEYKLIFQAGKGNKIIIRWNMPPGVNGTLSDIITGSFINVAMKGIGECIVNDPLVFNKLMLKLTFSNTSVIEETSQNNISPCDFELFQNYPNPFNSSTKIKYKLRGTTPVLLIIYDESGREITKLINEVQSAGEYIVEWNAKARSSRVYFCSLMTYMGTAARKLIYMK